MRFICLTLPWRAMRTTPGRMREKASKMNLTCSVKDGDGLVGNGAFGVHAMVMLSTCLQLDKNTTHLLLRCDLTKLQSISSFLGSCTSPVIPAKTSPVIPAKTPRSMQRA